MKLSEVSTEKGFQMIAELTPIIGRIVASDAVKDFVNKYGRAKVTWALGVRAITELAPVIFKDHVADACKIIAIMTEKTEAAVRKQKLKDSIVELKEIFSDKEFIELFQSSVNTEQAASSVSSPEAAGQSAATE